MATLNLGTTETLTVRPATTVSTSTLTLNRIVDTQDTQTVIAFTKELGQVILWQGQDYVNIGDWSQAQAEQQLITIANSLAV